MARTVRSETLQCRSCVTTMGTPGPTMPRSSSIITASESSSPTTAEAPWLLTKTASTGMAASSPARTLPMNSSHTAREAGPPGGAETTISGTGVQAPPRSISA